MFYLHNEAGVRVISGGVRIKRTPFNWISNSGVCRKSAHMVLFQDLELAQLEGKFPEVGVEGSRAEGFTW